MRYVYFHRREINAGNGCSRVTTTTPSSTADVKLVKHNRVHQNPHLLATPRLLTTTESCAFIWFPLLKGISYKLCTFWTTQKTTSKESLIKQTNDWYQHNPNTANTKTSIDLQYWHSCTPWRLINESWGMPPIFNTGTTWASNHLQATAVLSRGHSLVGPRAGLEAL